MRCGFLAFLVTLPLLTFPVGAAIVRMRPKRERFSRDLPRFSRNVPEAAGIPPNRDERKSQLYQGGYGAVGVD